MACRMAAARCLRRGMAQASKQITGRAAHSHGAVQLRRKAALEEALDLVDATEHWVGAHQGRDLPPHDRELFRLHERAVPELRHLGNEPSDFVVLLFNCHRREPRSWGNSTEASRACVRAGGALSDFVGMPEGSTSRNAEPYRLPQALEAVDPGIGLTFQREMAARPELCRRGRAAHALPDRRSAGLRRSGAFRYRVDRQACRSRRRRSASLTPPTSNATTGTPQADASSNV